MTYLQFHRKAAPAIVAALFLSLVVTLTGPARADSRTDTELWKAIGSGAAFAMMRHALAPGTGDPQTVVIGDCSTQRNLSDGGRQQSRDIGAAFRENGIDTARVFTSAWCRCVETAALLGLGKETVLPSLNSFFTARDREPAQTADLTKWIVEDRQNRRAGLPLVLVTHQVNITALTGVFPRSGEIIVARFDDGGNVEVIGRMLPAEAS